MVCLLLPEPSKTKVYREVRNLVSIDTTDFKANVETSLASTHPTARQLNAVLRSVLDQHAPAKCCEVSAHPPSLQYSAVGPQLLEAKRERRRAKRKWSASNLHVHRQIFQVAKITLPSSSSMPRLHPKNCTQSQINSREKPSHLLY